MGALVDSCCTVLEAVKRGLWTAQVALDLSVTKFNGEVSADVVSFAQAVASLVSVAIGGDDDAVAHGVSVFDSFSIRDKKAPVRGRVTVQPPNMSSNKV